MESYSMDENDFATWRSDQAVESKGIRLLWFCALSGQKSWTSSFDRTQARKHWMVHEVSWISWVERNRRRTSRVRAEYWHNTAVASWGDDDREQDPTSSEIESSSCRCTTASIGRKMETYKSVFWILWKLMRTPADFLKDIGHSSDQGQKKNWNAHLQAKQFVEPLYRYDNASSRRKWTSHLSSNLCVGPRIIEKQERRKVIESPQRWHVDRRVAISHNHFREPARCPRSDLGLARRIGSADPFSSTVKPAAKMNDKSPSISVPVQGDLLRRTFKWVKQRRCCIFEEKQDFSWTSWQSMHDMDAWKSWSMPRKDVTSKWCDSTRKDGFEYEKKGHASSVSMWNWNQSWIHEGWLISMEDCDLQRDEQIRWRTSRRKWWIYSLQRSDHKHGETRCDRTEGTTKSTIFVLKDVRAHWPTEVEWYSCRRPRQQQVLSYRVSKTVTRTQRHHGSHREDDGATDWNTLLPMLFRDHENARGWTNHEWWDHLHRGNDKKIFQYCMNTDGFIHYMRAIQGHSGANKVDPSLLDSVKFSFMWSEYLYQVGCCLCEYQKTKEILYQKVSVDTTEQSNTKTLLKNSTRRKRSSRVLRNGHLMIGFLFWHKEEEPRKSFNIAWILTLPDIIDPELQDNVLLPRGFTEYIYHVGNVSEVHSVIRNGVIPGGRSLKRDRHSVFFTIVNPMEDENCMEETPCDMTKPRIVPYTNIWKPHQNTVYWCTLKLAQEKGLMFHQTRSRAIVLYDTLPAVCIEKVVCMKTKDEWALPKGTLDSESTAGCTKIEPANRSTKINVNKM